jgi:hypothetical protein
VANEHRTARRFSRPSPLFRWADQQGLLRPDGRALVVGAGLLAEAEALLGMGWTVDALETSQSVEHRRELYEGFERARGARMLTKMAPIGLLYRLMVITHVVEFIEDPGERLALLRAATARLAAEGVLLISLRGWSDVRAARRAAPRGDGVVTGLGTWTRGFSVEDAKDLLARAGLAVVASPHPRSKTPEQVRLICKRAIIERRPVRHSTTPGERSPKRSTPSPTT